MRRKIFLIFSMVPFLFFTSYSDDPIVARVASIQAELRIEPSDYVGTFPVTIKVTGKITAHHPGVVKYKFIWKDGSVSNTSSVKFTTPGVKNINSSRVFGAPAQGWVKIRLLSPVNISSNLANYSLNPKITISADTFDKHFKPRMRIKPKPIKVTNLVINRIPSWKKIAEHLLPDLVIQSFKPVGDCCKSGETTRVAVEVANIGNVRSGACKLGITIRVPDNAPQDQSPGAEFTYTYSVPPLNPGTFCRLTPGWGLMSVGIWKFNVKADFVKRNPKGVVTEAEEGNNNTTKFLTVLQ